MAKGLRPGDVVESRDYAYHIEERVGAGGQANGYRSTCAELAEGPVFLKQYRERPFLPIKDVPRRVPALQNEIMKRLEDHTFIQRSFEFFEFDSCYYQSGVWQQGHSLGEYLRRDRTGYTARQRKIHAVTLTYALRVLHESCRVAHLDLSPNNVRIVAGSGGGDHVHLTDFDCASIAGEEPLIVAGTDPYVPPEKRDRDRFKQSGPIGAPSDVFSLGCLLYEMFFDMFPWADTPEWHLGLLIGDSEHAFHPAQLTEYFDESAERRALGEILWRSIGPYPSERPSAADIHSALGVMQIEDDSDFPEIVSKVRPFPAEEEEAPVAPDESDGTLELRSEGLTLVFDEATVLGRGQLRGIPDAATVSKKHIRLFPVEGEGWYVMHVGSTNPTQVDGSEIGKLSRRRLTAGATVQIGSVKLEVIKA